MNTNIMTTKMNTKILLILLWVFYTVNFMYCDSLTSLEPGVLAMTMSGYVADGTVKITEGFLLGTAVMFEIPFAMIVLSWVLKYRVNRWANIIAGVITILWVIGGGNTSASYIFFATIEVACMLLIVWSAWKWTEQEA